jgi:O-antigen/teichoic acid export membrane protein
VTDARLRRDIVWNLVPVALLGVVGLGLNFLIGAWWGPAALGVFNQVTTAFFVFSVVAAAGLQFSVLRAVAEAPDDREHVARQAVGALVPTAVLSAAATVLFVLLAQPIARWLDSDGVAVGILAAAPGLACFALNKVLLGIVNGLRRMRAFAMYTSLRYLLIATGLLLARGYDVDAYLLAGIWSFAEGCLLLVLLVELVLNVPLRRSRGWVAAAREHLRYGSRGVLATLAYEINSKLDVWLLGVALSDKAVGIYSLASALWEGVMQLGVVLQNNLNPMLARALAAGRKDEVEAIARRTRRWFVPAFVAICMVAAASYPFVVPWLIGNREFVEGAAPFAILLGGAALASTYLPFQTILMMASMPGAQTVFVVIVLVTNCAINLVLVPVLGLEGAAIASATALALSAVLLRFMVRARIGARL